MGGGCFVVGVVVWCNLVSLSWSSRCHAEKKGKGKGFGQQINFQKGGVQRGGERRRLFGVAGKVVGQRGVMNNVVGRIQLQAFWKSLPVQVSWVFLVLPCYRNTGTLEHWNWVLLSKNISWFYLSNTLGLEPTLKTSTQVIAWGLAARCLGPSGTLPLVAFWGIDVSWTSVATKIGLIVHHPQK